MEPFIIIEPFGLLAQNPDLFTEEQRRQVLLNGWADQIVEIARENPSRHD